MPNAGAPRAVHGAPLGFHGEASRSAWDVVDVSAHTAQLRLELISLPLRIDREVRVEGDTFTMVDRVSNLSDQDLEFDYTQHPAFGGELLDGECVISTGARRFVSDPEAVTILPSGQVSAWPEAETTEGGRLDLSRLPGPQERQFVFGWLEDFAEAWYAISNPERGLSVRVEWDGAQLPYAWFWQQLNHTVDYHWFRRARVQAIEPASTQTSGPERRSVMRLGPNASTTLPMNVTVTASATSAAPASATPTNAT